MNRRTSAWPARSLWEVDQINQALRATGNIRKAAEFLGVKRTMLYGRVVSLRAEGFEFPLLGDDRS